MNNIACFDHWLDDESSFAALTIHQWFEPAEGKDAIIFPPTYAKPTTMRSDEEWLGYNIDHFPDGANVCQLDSVGSQANRMEPIFARPRYRHLVPQVQIHAKTADADRLIDILEAGHRAADAIVRFSTLGPELHAAYMAVRQHGDVEPLARLAPTSIVFGSWDSRATQVKLPRIIRSVLRAYNVRVLRRSAQYSTIAGEILEDEAETTQKGPKAELGLAHVPATYSHGGVRVFGEIRRDSSLNLEALRALAPADGERLPLLRYILGLSLVALTAPMETSLREGCQLVADPERPAQWHLVHHDGTRESVALSHDEVLDYATDAASAFGVQDQDQPAEFDAELAKSVLKLDEDTRKTLLRQGPVTKERVDAAKKKSAAKKAKKDQSTSQEKSEEGDA